MRTKLDVDMTAKLGEGNKGKKGKKFFIIQHFQRGGQGEMCVTLYPVIVKNGCE